MTKEEQLEQVAKANRDLNECLLPNRIHLPPGLFERTKELAGRLRSIADGTTRALRLDRDADTPGVGESKRSEMKERANAAWPKAQEEFANAMYLLNALVADYQKRLGISDEPDYGPTPAKKAVIARIGMPVSWIQGVTALASPESEPQTKPEPPATDTPA